MTLTFANSVQRLTYEKVSDYLSTSLLFKQALRAGLNQPKFEIAYGSALIQVEVWPWEVHPWETGDLATVRAASCVTIGSRIDQELMGYLLSENSRMRFGAFYLGADSGFSLEPALDRTPDQANGDQGDHQVGEVWFAHSVLGGENMDLMELQTCILSVVTMADTYDDLIVERFGGQLGVDWHKRMTP
jgi:hypothetical protein